MAATKKTKALPARITNTPVSQASSINEQVASIVSMDQEEQFSDISMPDFLSEDAFEKVAPSGFAPLIQFSADGSADWQPGFWIIARFLGMRTDVGPNESAMYEFEVTSDKGKTFEVASLWGSTIFDTKFTQLAARPGDWVYIQYLGEVETSRKMNPAKQYRMAIMKPDVLKKQGYKV